MKQFKLLEDFCIKNNLEYDPVKQDQFSLFCDHLIEKNKVMNLTAITDPEEIEVKHFIDSIESASIIIDYAEKHNLKDQSINIIDMGTGAGFPGIPLAILFPLIHFTLVDSLEKRIKFINECLEICNINNVDTVHSRAEDIGHTEMRENFDICISRAVASMPVLLEYTLPMVKTDGIDILYKSGSFTEEMEKSGNALRILKGCVDRISEFELPGTDINRSLILINKTGHTPAGYPRKAGKPSKSPL